LDLPAILLGGALFLSIGVVCLGFPSVAQSYALWCMRFRPQWFPLRELELKYTSSKWYLIQIRLTGALALLMSGACFFGAFTTIVGE
jgi:hypothetical protein